MALVLLPFSAFLVLGAREAKRGWQQACVLAACACGGGLLWAW